jgi:hypothetical protein
MVLRPHSEHTAYSVVHSVGTIVNTGGGIVYEL